MKTKRLLAIIPARGGSKGIPRKNMVMLGGKPLIQWTIDAALNSKYITKIIVSSDSEEILSFANKNGVEGLERPAYLADDKSSSESVVKHCLSKYKKEFEYIILLQPTSPLRSSKDIDLAFEKMLNIKSDSLISVKEVDNKVLKSFIKKKGYLIPISDSKFPFMRRQDLPNLYFPNGAIYIVKNSFFKKNNSFYSRKTIPYLMDEESSTDIDTREDLLTCEIFIKH